MTMEEQRHVALPKLYGAPAYARPVVAVAHASRPLSPDDLPLVAEMSEDDRDLLAPLPGSGDEPAGTAGQAVASGGRVPGGLFPRSFSIRAFADRLRRPRP
jgi:hypothetical protein